MRRGFHYIDSNIFIYPIIYDQIAVKEAKKSRDFLLEIASGNIEAHASLITWDDNVDRSKVTRSRYPPESG